MRSKCLFVCVYLTVNSPELCTHHSGMNIDRKKSVNVDVSEEADNLFGLSTRVYDCCVYVGLYSVRICIASSFLYCAVHQHWLYRGHNGVPCGGEHICVVVALVVPLQLLGEVLSGQLWQQPMGFEVRVAMGTPRSVLHSIKGGHWTEARGSTAAGSTYMLPEYEGEDGSRQLCQEDEKDEHEELRRARKREGERESNGE